MNDALRFSAVIALTIAACSAAAWLSLATAGGRDEAASREPVGTNAGPPRESARQGPPGAGSPRDDDAASDRATYPGADA